MEQVGLHKGTIYIFPAAIGVGGYCTLPQLQEMYAAGWDIGNHDEHQVLTDLNQAECEASLTACKDYLDTNGMPRGSRHVAYPFGARNATVDAAMAASGMLTGRITTGTAFDPASPPDAYLIPSPAVSSTVQPGDVQNLILDAVRCGHVLVLQFHGIVASPTDENWSIANFQALCDWIVEKGYNLSTISDVYDQVYGG